jgi:putative SOS response-associated peptidase YedK
MCGRFTLTATPAALNDLVPLFDNIELVPHYNVAPTQNVLAVRLRQGTKEPQAVRLRWGLVPSWADDHKIGPTPAADHAWGNSGSGRTS